MCVYDLSVCDLSVCVLSVCVLSVCDLRVRDLNVCVLGVCDRLRHFRLKLPAASQTGLIMSWIRLTESYAADFDLMENTSVWNSLHVTVSTGPGENVCTPL